MSLDGLEQMAKIERINFKTYLVPVLKRAYTLIPKGLFAVLLAVFWSVRGHKAHTKKTSVEWSLRSAEWSDLLVIFFSRASTTIGITMGPNPLSCLESW